MMRRAVPGVQERCDAVLEEIGRAFADVPAEELEREIGLALAAARAERHAVEP